MAEFINTNPGAESFRAEAVDSLGNMIEKARKETSEASAALPAEAAGRQAYSEACMSANTILVRGTKVVRAIFGRISAEYKQSSHAQVQITLAIKSTRRSRTNRCWKKTWTYRTTLNPNLSSRRDLTT
jgi:hypothetical protein